VWCSLPVLPPCLKIYHFPLSGTCMSDTLYQILRLFSYQTDVLSKPYQTCQKTLKMTWIAFKSFKK
jgi:hypothetical protein